MSLENSELLGQFVQIVVWCLGAVLLCIQIVKSFRRHPPLEADFTSKNEFIACQQRCTEYSTKNDAANIRRDKESSESRSRLYNQIEQLRRDMDAGMRVLGEQGAGQQASIDLQGQMLARLDVKLDAIREKI